jgi:hypothetical protein
MALNYEAFFVIKRFFCEVTRAYCSFNIRPVPVGHPVYAIYTRPLSAQAQYSRSFQNICSLHYNSSQDTWTVVRLTAATFKPIMQVNSIFGSKFNFKSYCEVLCKSVLVKYFVRVF